MPDRRPQHEWRLVWWDAAEAQQPSDRPPADAELSADGMWATVYRPHGTGSADVPTVMWMKVRVWDPAEFEGRGDIRSSRRPPGAL